MLWFRQRKGYYIFPSLCGEIAARGSFYFRENQRGDRGREGTGDGSVSPRFEETQNRPLSPVEYNLTKRGKHNQQNSRICSETDMIALSECCQNL